MNYEGPFIRQGERFILVKEQFKMYRKYFGENKERAGLLWSEEEIANEVKKGSWVYDKKGLVKDFIKKNL